MNDEDRVEAVATAYYQSLYPPEATTPWPELIPTVQEGYKRQARQFIAMHDALQRYSATHEVPGR